MSAMPLKVCFLKHYAGEKGKLHYATSGSSGFDLVYSGEYPIILGPYNGGSATIHSHTALLERGMKFILPYKYELQIRSRSGLALKQQLIVLNSPGTIDSDYTGEIKVILANFGEFEVSIERGMRIAQAVLCPIERASAVSITSEQMEEFEEELKRHSERGSGGFGSTGI